MSWLFGIFKKKNVEFPEFNLNEEFQKVTAQSLFLAVSSQNHSSYINNSANEINAFVGIPISEFDGKKRIITKNSYDSVYSSNLNELDGHFVWVNYKNKILTIKNDSFGLRDLYYYDTDDYFFFSTRFDLLKSYTKQLNLDPKNFSTLWLANFQLNTR